MDAPKCLIPELDEFLALHHRLVFQPYEIEILDFYLPDDDDDEESDDEQEQDDAAVAA